MKIVSSRIYSHIQKQFKRLYNNEIKKICRCLVVGTPNSGKSTLINSIVNEKILSTSPIANTTNLNRRMALNISNTQIIFTDTPGIVGTIQGRRMNVSKEIINSPQAAVDIGCDVILVVHDGSIPSQKKGLNSCVLKFLNENKKFPTLLAINKVDLIKDKYELIKMAERLTNNNNPEKYYNETDVDGWNNFKFVFMVSALQTDGVNDILQYLITNYSHESSWILESTYNYTSNPNIISDFNVKQQIAEICREKLFYITEKEIPFNVTPVVENIEFNDKNQAILRLSLVCTRKSIERIMILKYKQLNSSIYEDVKKLLKVDHLEIKILPKCI